MRRGSIFGRRSCGGFGALALLLAVGGCGTLPDAGFVQRSDGPPAQPVDVSSIPDAVPRVEPPSKYGNPASYEVGGRRYYVSSDSANYTERGIASWYGTKFHGRRTSSGEPYDMYAMTAAHRTLPLPTYAKVENLRNGRSVIVKINDRGPFKDNRLIDLSYAAAMKLGITGTGLVEVRAIDPVAYHARKEKTRTDGTATEEHATLYLQIGAFSERENAERLRRRLDPIASRNIHIIRSNDTRPALFRVRIGPLTDVNEADRVSRRITAAGLDTPHIVID